MARPRLSYGLTIDQITDYIVDCSKDDLMLIVASAVVRRESLRAFLQNKRDNITNQLATLDALTPVAPVTPADPIV